MKDHWRIKVCVSGARVSLANTNVTSYLHFKEEKDALDAKALLMAAAAKQGNHAELVTIKDAVRETNLWVMDLAFLDLYSPEQVQAEYDERYAEWEKQLAIEAKHGLRYAAPPGPAPDTQEPR